MATATINASSGSALALGYGAQWVGCQLLIADLYGGGNPTVSVDSASTTRYLIVSRAGPWWGGAYAVGRALLPFDLSSIPSGATISAATLGVYVVSRDSSTFAQTLYVDTTTQASLTAATVADAQSVAGVSCCDTQPTVGSLSLGAYQTFALNATGLAACTPGGAAKLALRMSNDWSNTDPASGNESVIYINMDNAASNKPYLEVTYSVPGSSLSRRRRPSGLYIR